MTSHALRVFSGNRQIFATAVSAESDEMMLDLIPGIMQRIKPILTENPRHIIEIEFLDEPDPKQRYFRFGTDPNGMTVPVEITPEELKRMDEDRI
jgi:hypothetical protein